jgi:sulfide:quinone oxidoreductase
VVAANIAAQIKGEPSRARFDGRGGCFIEVGDGMAAYGEGDFFAFPEPSVSLEPASAAHKRAKQEFERILDTWFVTD